MALLRCPDCLREVSDAAAACPNCGKPMKVGAARSSPETSSATAPVAKAIALSYKQVPKWLLGLGVITTGGLVVLMPYVFPTFSVPHRMGIVLGMEAGVLGTAVAWWRVRKIVVEWYGRVSKR